MDNTTGLTPHDALELSEVMNGAMTIMKMMQMNMNQVQDPDLKTFMQQTLEARRIRMQAMQQFISNQHVINKLQ
ncbi:MULTISPECIES: hypothetical protein [Sporomusa]|uniref:hypothetical protein n=1 Tax=Sporomusa TaxID=2375 RepID=UPI001666312C|nr:MULTISPECIES: hypothetical protein [Sporomusa]MCM0759883.1 hypothetical protein [Sporomusa sphaeroides DSM 2875]HML34620.1 hypothetical protein [Sporomusa sphaeroides]